MKAKLNMKGLGLKQHQLLYRMAKENLVISLKCVDLERPLIDLEDMEGDNIYESVPFRLFESLRKRKLFNYKGWMPSLFVTVDTFYLKKEVIKSLGLSSGQEPEECDATEADSSIGAGKTK